MSASYQEEKEKNFLLFIRDDYRWKADFVSCERIM